LKTTENEKKEEEKATQFEGQHDNRSKAEGTLKEGETRKKKKKMWGIL